MNPVFVVDKDGYKYAVSSKVCNRSELYVGASGSGKTSCMLKRIVTLVEEGAKVINIAFAGSWMREGFSEKLLSRYGELTTHISAKSGLSLPLSDATNGFRSLEVARLLSKSIGLSPTREAALVIALKKACLDGAVGEEGLGVISRYLTRMDTSAASVAAAKLDQFLDGVLVQDGALDFSRPILEISFDGLLLEQQVALVELLLETLLRAGENGAFGQEHIVVAIDEFQFLSGERFSALRSLLEVGRKGGISLLLATPELPLSKQAASYVAMQQCATVAFFKPGVTECRKLARIIAPREVPQWTLELSMLSRGDFVVMGEFLTENGSIANGPIIVTMPDVSS